MNKSATLSSSSSQLKYEMSKTYQYRKVMKPLLERKRRARINKCLDDLKDLIAEYVQQQNNDTNIKLEKADILELAVRHLRKVKNQKSIYGDLQEQQQRAEYGGAAHSFRSGYIRAADEVSRYLASLPKVDITLGTTLMTHLGLRLNQIQSYCSEPVTPLDMSSSYSVDEKSTKPMCSPHSSGYGSDSDCSTSSSSYSSSSRKFSAKLVKPNSNSMAINVNANNQQSIWRPW